MSVIKKSREIKVKIVDLLVQGDLCVGPFIWVCVCTEKKNKSRPCARMCP